MERKKLLTPKKEMFLHIINILILAFLCIAIFLNGRTLTCDQCKINFQSSRVMNIYQSNVSVQVQQLYDYYQEGGHCLVVWDRTQGFILDYGN